MPRPRVARVIATRRPSGTVHPLFPANSDVQDVLVHLRSSSSGSLTSCSSSSSSRRHEQSLSGLRSPARFASSSPWIPNPLRPKLLHPPSVLPNPFNRSPTPHLAGNRRFPVRREKERLKSTSTSTTYPRPLSARTRYGNRSSSHPRCSCSPYSPAFAGQSTGTPPRRRSRPPGPPRAAPV